MALISGIDTDIFSHAPLDTETFPDQVDGWIKQLYSGLNLMAPKNLLVLLLDQVFYE